MTEVAAEKHHLIAPHGGYLVDRTGPRPHNADSLEQVPLTSRELSDLDMLASGALSPLEGFMGRDDYERVLEEMRLAKGIPWALPVCLAVDHEPQGDEVTLTDEAGSRSPSWRWMRSTSTTRSVRRETPFARRTRPIQAWPGSTPRSRSTSPAR